MSDREAETPELPNTWQEIQADEIYQSSEGILYFPGKQTTH
jgi:hypothetical protein